MKNKNQTPMFNPYDPYDIMLLENPSMKNLTPEEQQEVAVKTTLFGCASYVLAIAIGLVICALLGSCTTTKYVTVPEVHTDTVRITSQQRDSIVLHDSIYVNQYTRGDTVFLQVDRWHTQYRDRWHTDTAYISRRDSIPVPYPVEKMVPAQLSGWQNFQLWLGRLVLVALAVLTGIWLIRKRAWWLRLFLKHE